jgi:hypothetical protein
MNWYKKATKYRGLYHQPEGSETRPSSDVDAEKLDMWGQENRQHIATLKVLLKRKDWNAYNAYRQKLLEMGMSARVFDGLSNAAMSGIRL